MIAPEVRMHDLNPDGFAALNKRLSAVAWGAGEATLTVLHAGGSVINAVHSSRGVVGVEELEEPEVMRVRHAVDRVLLLDRSRLGDLSSRLVDLARLSANQGELLWRAREVWNSHEAVVQSPAPEPSKWPAVSDRLARVPDDAWVVARIRYGEGQSFVVAGCVVGGVLVEITSSVPADAAVAATIDASLDDDPADVIAWLDEVTTWT
jgi:hypothetical protein